MADEMNPQDTALQAPVSPAPQTPEAAPSQQPAVIEPGAPVSQPTVGVSETMPQKFETQPVPINAQLEKRHMGDMLYGFMSSVMGKTPIYSMDTNTGKMKTDYVKTGTGQFFKNILIGALAGGAMAAEEHARQPAMGFGAGLAVGGAAGVQEARQQDALRRKRAEEDFKRGQEVKEAKGKEELQKSEMLKNNAQMADSTVNTLRLYGLYAGETRARHQALVDSNLAVLKPIVNTPGFKWATTTDGKTTLQDISPEKHEQLLRESPASYASLQWFETSVPTGKVDPVSNLPGYDFRWSAYDPNQKLEITMLQPTIDALAKYNPSKTWTELQNVIKSGHKKSLWEVTQLWDTARKQYAEMLENETAEQTTVRRAAEIKLLGSQAKESDARAMKDRADAYRQGKDNAKADKIERANKNWQANIEGKPASKGKPATEPLDPTQAFLALDQEDKSVLTPELLKISDQELAQWKALETEIGMTRAQPGFYGASDLTIKTDPKYADLQKKIDRRDELGDSMATRGRMISSINKDTQLTNLEIQRQAEKLVKPLSGADLKPGQTYKYTSEAAVRKDMAGSDRRLIEAAVNIWKRVRPGASPSATPPPQPHRLF